MNLRLKRRDRQVMSAEDFTLEEVGAVATAEIPDEYARLDEELNDWAR